MFCLSRPPARARRSRIFLRSGREGISAGTEDGIDEPSPGILEHLDGKPGDGEFPGGEGGSIPHDLMNRLDEVLLPIPVHDDPAWGPIARGGHRAVAYDTRATARERAQRATGT